MVEETKVNDGLALTMDQDNATPLASYGEERTGYAGVSRPKKKSLTWDQCTFTSILPSLKEDIAREQRKEGFVEENKEMASGESREGGDTSIGIHEQENWSALDTEMKQNNANVHVNMQPSASGQPSTSRLSFDNVTRSTSPVCNDSIPSSSPSSSTSSTTASTGISSSDSTPPLSPVLTDPPKPANAIHSATNPNPPPGFISRSTYNPQSFADRNLETIVEDDTASDAPIVKESPRFINRRRVTLGANLDDVEYAEAMASRLVNGLYPKASDGGAARRNSSFEVQNMNIHDNSLFGWGVDSDTDGSGALDDSANDIDVDGLRKQMDSWRTFFAVDDKQEEEIQQQQQHIQAKPPTPSRRHSTPPIHINPPTLTPPPSSEYAPKMPQQNMRQQNVPMAPMPPMPPAPPPPMPPQMPVGQYPQFGGHSPNPSGHGHNQMMHQQINAPPFIPGQHQHDQHQQQQQQQFQQWSEWMNYMNQYQQQQQQQQQHFNPMMMHGQQPHGANGDMYMDHHSKGPHSRKGASSRRGNKQGRGFGPRQTCESLAEFRATGNRPSMEALVGHVVEYSKDSHGSRFIQFKMETASPEEKKILVEEILQDTVALASHPFGNYVIQNFLLHATKEQRYAIANTFRGSMVKLSTQAHGCRVVQHAFDILDVAQRNVLQSEIVDNIYAVAKNNHGTHVVQKCMNILLAETKWGKARAAESNRICFEAKAPTSAELLEQVEKAVCREFLRLSVHPHSYRLVQQTLGNCDPERSPAIGEMMKIVEQYYHTLAIDQHGNFILQHILDNGSLEQVEHVQAFVCSRVLELSQHKFGSHLVEKCLTSATKNQSRAIVEQLLSPTDQNLAHKKKISGDNANQSTLLLMSKDPYANFVVQRAFDASEGEMRSRIANQIRQQADVLSRFTYGRHILSHINRAET